jgi:D-3-phosphoglycerate dehydrogenase
MKALILAPFYSEALERLNQAGVEVIYESWLDTGKLYDPEELGERLRSQDIDMLVVEADFVFEEVFQAAPGLKLIGICRAAVDHIDIASATEHGVMVINTPARNAIAVAELTLGLMLCLARRIPRFHNLVKEGSWVDPVGPYREQRGIELAGKTAGIIGLGAVGREVTRRLNSLGMRVLCYDPYITSEVAGQVGATLTSLEALLSQSDFISLHCALTTETDELLNGERLALLKHGAYLVNTAAWELVSEKALVAALEQRRIAGAAFDVYESHPVSPASPLLKLENVILTPHIGGATEDTIRRYSLMIVEDIERFLLGQSPLHLVNPEVRHAL